MARPRKQPTTHEDEYSASLSTRRAAEFLGVSPRTMQAWRARRVGPAWCVIGDRAIVYRLADLHAYQRDGRRAPPGGTERCTRAGKLPESEDA